MGYAYHIDVFDRTQIVGWIYDETNLNQPVKLGIWRRGQEIVSVLADQARPDLVEAKIAGHGKCSFDLKLAPLVDPMDGSSLEIRVSSNGQVIDQVSGFSDHFNSAFGGFWIDRTDFLSQIPDRLRDGRLPEFLLKHVVEFAVEGYTVFPQVIEASVVDQINADVDELWKGNEPRAMLETYQINNELKYVPIEPKFKNGKNKLLDLYAFSEAARSAILNSTVTKFLECIFEEPVTAFQSLSFLYGSEQPTHQDTAFVRVMPPMKLAASWIALEDIQPGTGELEYFVSSHLNPEFLFGGRSKWMAMFPDELQTYLDSLIQSCESQNRKRQKFQARKGDVLLWHADLAHGGSQISNPNRTRKSLVTHYCPLSARPCYEDKSKQNSAIYRDRHQLKSGIVDLTQL